MTLAELIRQLPPGTLRPVPGAQGSVFAPVTDIAYDSRKVTEGSVFVAVKGEKSDGHDFLAAAVKAGAVAVVGEDEAKLKAAGTAVFVTKDARRAMALLADALYGHPSQELDIVGITGTNGKTTVAHLVERLYAGLGCKTGRIGTLGVKIGDVEEEGARTTPEAPDIQRTLRRMVDAGAQKVAMEVSSHALAQDRTWGIRFPVVVFTNLTQDHLDYHADMEAYYQAKKRLFTDYEPLNGYAVINVDDPYGKRLATETQRANVTTYGCHTEADFRATDIRTSASGSEFTLHWCDYYHPVHLKLPGLFNIYNALAALAALTGYDVVKDLLPTLETLTGAPGRLEAVDAGQDFGVLVDYAHTPDALENVLRAAREITPSGRVLAVFGCGGDRDKTKRPQMGRIAVERADVAFVTSDNPRTENPDAIITDIVAGLNGAKNYSVDADRRAAIFAAIAEAKPGDTVVIAGKGHEDYQIIGTTKHHFDDREVAREALEARRRG